MRSPVSPSLAATAAAAKRGSQTVVRGFKRVVAAAIKSVSPSRPRPPAKKDKKDEAVFIVAAESQPLDRKEASGLQKIGKAVAAPEEATVVVAASHAITLASDATTLTQTLVGVAVATHILDRRVLKFAGRTQATVKIDDALAPIIAPTVCPGAPRPGQHLRGAVVVSCCGMRQAAVLPQLQDCNVESIGRAHGAEVVVFQGSLDDQFRREFAYALGSATVTKILVVGAATVSSQVASTLARMPTLRAKSLTNTPVSVSATTSAGFVRTCFGHDDSDIAARGDSASKFISPSCAIDALVHRESARRRGGATHRCASTQVLKKCWILTATWPSATKDQLPLEMTRSSAEE